jgi:Photosynthetic reaction centre cytochrome C subunit
MASHRRLLGSKTRWLLLVVLLLSITNAVAQFPEKFTNLQVLPKDSSKSDLQATMRGFAFALNVRCPYCHVQKADMKMDFAADDKDPKKTARVMLQMVAAINHDYVSKIGKPPSVKVECATCHRGLTQPRMLNSVLADTIEKEGIDAATRQYHDLRGQYYGTGQYDFGETPLNQLTESLLAKNKNKEAVAIMEMNFAANNPTSVWSYHMLAMSHLANGEIEKAKADYSKVFALHPDDSWAKQQIDALSSPK